MSLTLQFIKANLIRRPLRTAVTTIGVAVAVAMVYSLLGFQSGYQRGMRADLDRLGAHLLVVPKGCPYDAASLALHGASWPCYLKSAYIETVRHTPHVATAAPVLMSAVNDTASKSQMVYCGVEKNIMQLKPSWRFSGGTFPEAGQILAGADAANTNHWRIGQEVRLPGLPNQRAQVAGILAPTQGTDDLFVFLPLSDAQKAFSRPGEITHILVRLDAPEKVDEVVADLRGCDAGLDMDVVPLAHLFHTIQNLVQGTRLLLGCVALIALLAAGAGVSNTILMAVIERTREIGVLRAIGGSRGRIFGLIWTETVLLCIAGAAVGIAAALAGARLIDAWLRMHLPFAPHDVLIGPDGRLMLMVIAGAAVVGTLAGLAPALRAAHLSPAAALRTIGGTS
jgi:putative ABC transport system permease protein